MSTAWEPAEVLYCSGCDSILSTRRPIGVRKTRIPCPKCNKTTQCITSSPRFNRTLWEVSSQTVLDFCLSHFKQSFTPRQERLFWCGLARIHSDRDQSNNWLRSAIEFGEKWAETGSPPFGVDDLQRALAHRNESPNENDWELIAGVCVANVPSHSYIPSDPAFDRARADLYRDLIPNPFLPLTWNPDWFTSTVRDLASHISTAREFTSMPILADALQDAGCDDEQILTHCRANKPHARGCWVLDAILGKA
jgi:hypothetical protein